MSFAPSPYSYAGATLASANAGQLAFVGKVTKLLSFKPTVSSYGRTPYEQGAAMLAKHAAAGGGSKGDAELHAIYAADASIDTLLSLSPRNAETWGAWIGRYGLDLSRHLKGTAVDFSVRGLTRTQIEALKTAIGAVGGRALEEFAPPHVHADVSRAGAVAGDLVVAAKEHRATLLPVFLLLGSFWVARRQGWV